MKFLFSLNSICLFYLLLLWVLISSSVFVFSNFTCFFTVSSNQLKMGSVYGFWVVFFEFSVECLWVQKNLKKKKNLKNNLKKSRDNKAISFFVRFSKQTNLEISNYLFESFPLRKWVSSAEKFWLSVPS